MKDDPSPADSYARANTHTHSPEARTNATSRTRFARHVSLRGILPERRGSGCMIARSVAPRTKQRATLSGYLWNSRTLAPDSRNAGSVTDRSRAHLMNLTCS
jgi:hypothetical protein